MYLITNIYIILDFVEKERVLTLDLKKVQCI